MALEGERNRNVPSHLAGEDPIRLKIEDEYSLYSIRTATLERARRIGMAEHDLSELEIIIRELVTNVITHGGKSGHVVISHIREDATTSILMDVVDRGPGFEDFDRALEDGYSTTGSMGGGLPSVRRFAERVELVHSGPGGSHLRVTKRVTFDAPQQDEWTFSLFTRPHPDEVECGDQGTLIRNRDGILLVLADGLGHGKSASEASKLAITEAHANHRLPLPDLIRLMHKKLKKTRGSAVSLARVTPKNKSIEWLGIGNVTGRIVRMTSPESVQQEVFANFNGTVGVQIGSYHPILYTYKPGDWIMMASDGLNTHQWMKPYIQTKRRTPYEIGKNLVHDAARERDDVAVLLGRSRL